MWVSFSDQTINQIFAHMKAGRVDEAIELLRGVIVVGRERDVVERIYECNNYEATHLLPIMQELFGVDTRLLSDGNWQKMAIKLNLRNF